MSTHLEYQKFRHGDSCIEEGCRARKFYIEDGRKFCQRGHEQTVLYNQSHSFSPFYLATSHWSDLQGFTQTQQDEDDWKSQGKKSRAKREEPTTTTSNKPTLSGSDARELYLQCFQLILWKQCHWLIEVKNLPPELETVVRDLWGLRLGCLSKVLEERSGYSSGTGTQMFSSTSEGEDSEGGSEFSGRSQRRRRKRKDEGDRLPKMVETLGLLYLSMLLMRLPIGLGQVVDWVRCDEIVFNRAVSDFHNHTKEALMVIRLPRCPRRWESGCRSILLPLSRFERRWKEILWIRAWSSW